MIGRMDDIYHAIDAYIGELARRGRTQATRNKYQWLLWQFAAHLGHRNLGQVDRWDCRRFLDRWVDASPSTIALHVSILRGFFDFLVAETALDTSPMDGIERPRRRRPEDIDVVSVSARDVERLLEVVEDWQEFLCVAVLCYLGPRRSAASRLRRRDVNLDRGEMRLLEKGRKTPTMPLPDELAAIIRAADEQHVWTSGDDYLIPNRRQPRNRERSAKVVYDTVKKIAKRAGITTHVHALRAAFAVQFDEQNPGRVIALKELLGHSRIETTMVYLRRKDRAAEMETVRGLSWGSVFPPSRLMPPTGFEPVFSAEGIPEPIRRKLEELRARSEEVRSERG